MRWPGTGFCARWRNLPGLPAAPADQRGRGSRNVDTAHAGRFRLATNTPATSRGHWTTPRSPDAPADAGPGGNRHRIRRVAQAPAAILRGSIATYDCQPGRPGFGDEEPKPASTSTTSSRSSRLRASRSEGGGHRRGQPGQDEPPGSCRRAGAATGPGIEQAGRQPGAGRGLGEHRVQRVPRPHPVQNVADPARRQQPRGALRRADQPVECPGAFQGADEVPGPGATPEPVGKRSWRRPALRRVPRLPRRPGRRGSHRSRAGRGHRAGPR
jgi:hypothetical protein